MEFKLIIFTILSSYLIITIKCRSTTTTINKDIEEINCRNYTNPYDVLQEIECPRDKPVIHVEISDFTKMYSTSLISKNRKVKILIRCFFNMKPDNYSLLPNTNNGDIYEVEFRRCPLPLGTPIVNIIKRFGNPNVVSFKFYADENETILPIHLKELNELQRIQLKNVEFSGSSENLFINATKLKWMDLRYTNANNIPKDIFKPLINLTTLELGGSKLHELQPGMFINQKNLIKLNLWSNNLQKLPGSVFEGVINLSELDLMLNNFETFDSDSFSLLKNLTNLNLSSNNLTLLPENLFKENKLLSNIRIQTNRVDLIELPKGLFSNLPNLKNVTLFKDGIRILPNDLFKGSTNIELLEIVQNQIEILPKDIFEDQISLQTLNLKNNKLISLDDNLFANNNKLRTLDISNNELETLSIYSFFGLNNLETLELNNNKLINFEPEIMQPLINLKEIYLQNNQLNFNFHGYDIGSPLNKLLNIEIINLQNNSITGIYPDWFTALLHLKSLDLSYNKITMLTKEDLQFTRPHLLLNLTNNNITTINLDKINEQHETYAVSDSIIEIDINNNPLNCNCDIATFSNVIKNYNSYELIAKHLNFKHDNLTCNNVPNNWPYNLTGQNIAKINSDEFVCQQTTPCPKNCSCWFRTFDRSVIINCSNSELTEVPTLFDATAKSIQWIELHIENNKITKLPTLKNIGYNRVQEIYAQNNSIIDLKPENIPRSLRILNLAENNMSIMNVTVLSAINRTRSINNISLGGNPWKCNCDTAKFINFIQTKHKIINDINQLKCIENGKRIETTTLVDICFKDNTLIIAMCIVLVLLAIFIAAIIALYYKYQLEFKLWLFEHNLFLSLITEEELDKNKKYDAFISYSHKDEDFVSNELVRKLENGPNPFKLCVHARDWVPGEWIQNQIHNSVEESRRTIVVLSKDFLESVWGQMEFRTAHTAALTEGRTRVIIIIKGDIGDIEKLDPILKSYLKMNTYVEWADPWFWNKLRYAMPHPQNVKLIKNKTKGLCKKAIKNSTDDKLELIKPLSVTPPLTSTPPANSASINPLMAILTPETQSTNSNIPVVSQPQQYPNLNGTVNVNNLQQKNNLPKILPNGHTNGAFVINTNSKQSDV